MRKRCVNSKLSGLSPLNISRSKRTSPALSSTRRTWSAFSFMSVATEGYTELGLSFPMCGSRSRGLSARVRAIARGYWLRETVLQARLANWADVSDAALLKRLRNRGEWLRSLCNELLRENGVSTFEGRVEPTRRC